MENQEEILTLLHIPAGSMTGRTCCMKGLAIHWSHTARTAAAVAAAAVGFHRPGSTAPTDCTRTG